jgi:hypothetical protein
MEWCVSSLFKNVITTRAQRHAVARLGYCGGRTASGNCKRQSTQALGRRPSLFWPPTSALLATQTGELRRVNVRWKMPSVFGANCPTKWETLERFSPSFNIQLYLWQPSSTPWF